MIVLIMIGPPGSGKTTERNKILKKNPEYSVISRDEIRKFLSDKNISNLKRDEFESIVSGIEDSLVKSYLKKDISFIWDNMNLKLSYLKDNIAKIRNIKPECSISLKIMETELKQCLSYNELRKGTDAYVPTDVIQRKYQIFKSNYNSYKDCLNYEEKTEIKPHIFSKDKKEAIIIDIDGTLAHADSRNIFDLTKIHYDSLDKAVAGIVNNEKCFKIILSGRENRILNPPIENCGSVKELTELWLKMNDIKYDMLFLRIEGDKRKDVIVKGEIYEKYINPLYNIKYALDDRDSIVSLWRELGIKCLQVAKGDF